MQNFTPKNKDPATWTPLTTSVELKRSAREAVPVPQLVLVMLALALHKVININSVILVFCIYINM
jgi:hypothetical protein